MKTCITCNQEKKIEEFRLSNNKWRAKNCAKCLNKRYYKSYGEPSKHPQKKRCKGCDTFKKGSEFYNSGRYLSTLCKPCTLVKRKADRAKKAIRELNEMRATRRGIKRF